MEYKIPLLTARDVECRVQQVTDKGHAILLLYKDARVDMKMLDKVFGPNNWQRHHQMINGELFCTISVWDEEKKQWIEKEDVGTESNTEAKKGQASDSFKRSGFNWGIGRELYNSPFICCKLNEDEIKKNRNGKPTTYTKFSVQSMTYNEESEQFTEMVIVDNNGNVRFNLNGQTPKTPKPAVKQEQKQQEQPKQESHSQLTCSNCGFEIDKAVSDFSIRTYGAELCRVCQAKKKQGLI